MMRRSAVNGEQRETFVYDQSPAMSDTGFRFEQSSPGSGVQIDHVRIGVGGTVAAGSQSAQAQQGAQQQQQQSWQQWQQSESLQWSSCWN